MNQPGLGAEERAQLGELWSLVPLLLVGGVAYGLYEAARDPAVLGLRAHLDAAVLAGIPALFIGLAMSPCLALLRRSAAWQRAAAALEAATRREPGSDRGPVIRLHAVLSIVALVVAASAGLSSGVLPRLFALQEQGLGVALAVVLTLLMVLAMAVAVFALQRPVESVLRRLDRRWALPLPPWAGLRYLLFVALPSGLVLSWFARIQGDLLGVVGLWIAIPFVLVSAGLVAHLWRRVRPRSRRSRRLIGSAVMVAWGVAVAISAQRPAYGVETRSSSPAAALGSLVARSLARGAVTSVRRDADAVAAVTPAAGADQIFSGAARGSRSKHNVVWVIIDALRADRVGAVRNGRPITPHLDRLAREAVVFERAYAQGTSTSYSIPSMLTGRNVDAISWGWAHGRPQIPDSEHTIAERLRARGYQTAIVPSKFIHGSLTGTLQGYQSKSVVAGSASTRRHWDPRTSPIATAKALAQLGALAPGPVAQRPFFLTVYYGDPHAPYVNHADHVPPFPDTLEGRYDAEVAFVDLHLGQLIEHLRIRAPLWERTILIVTSDHGEAFGEHGRERHGRDCHVEAVHVPLLVRVPGVPAARVALPVALVDIVPMLIELTGAEEGGMLSGRSLLIPMRAPERVDPSRAIFCAAAHQRSDQRPFLVRAVRQSGYVLMHSASGAQALFDANSDPGERQDILDQPAHAERARQLAQLLASSFTGNVGEAPPAEHDPAASDPAAPAATAEGASDE